MGTVPLARSWALTYRYRSTPNPTSSLSTNAGLSVSFRNSQMPPRPCLPLVWNGKSTRFEILPFPWYQHPIAPLSPLHPYFLFSPSWHLLTLMSDYLYSWWKPQCWLEALNKSTFIVICLLQWYLKTWVR